MRMRKRRILPATWPRTTWSLSSFSRKMAFGKASMTSPSNSTFSSLAMPSGTVAVDGSAGGGRRRASCAVLPGARSALPGRRGSRRLLGVRRPLRRRLVGVGRVLRAAAVLVRRPLAVVLGVVGPGLLLPGAGRVVLLRPLGARARVLAEERLRAERHLGLGEVAAELALGRLHVRAPDRRGDRAALGVGSERVGVLRV